MCESCWGLDVASTERYSCRNGEQGSYRWWEMMGLIGGRMVLSVVIGYECVWRRFIPKPVMDVIRTNNSPTAFAVKSTIWLGSYKIKI